MKSAKEWATEVVDEHDGALVLYHLGGGRAVTVDVDVDASELEDVIADARANIEHLAERVQADACEQAISMVDSFAAGLSHREPEVAKDVERLVAWMRKSLNGEEP